MKKSSERLKSSRRKTMGFFSWKTSDTNKSISNKYSDRGALPVYLYCPDGTKIYEPDYDGYGDFAGQDAYALLARWNRPELCNGDDEHDRSIGIDIGCYDHQMAKLKYPLKFAESDSLTYAELKPAVSCPDQGFFYGGENWEYE